MLPLKRIAIPDSYLMPKHSDIENLLPFSKFITPDSYLMPKHSDIENLLPLFTPDTSLNRYP